MSDPRRLLRPRTRPTDEAEPGEATVIINPGESGAQTFFLPVGAVEPEMLASTLLKQGLRDYPLPIREVKIRLPDGTICEMNARGIRRTFR
jgi:hypothetical protein